jgi:hypothetical protein
VDHVNISYKIDYILCPTLYVCIRLTKRFHWQEFAGEGLRTLALAYKDVDPEYMEDWKLRHHVANTAMDEREEKLDALYEEIEKGLLVCTTGRNISFQCLIIRPTRQSTSID